MAALFSFQQASDLARALKRRRVRYLFIGKGGAIILGFPDTTQDADVFVEKSAKNGERLVAALDDLGFKLSAERKAEIRRCKDFVQIRNGPFDVDFIFAPDGIESFAEASRRALTIKGLRVAHIDDIIKSKKAANRVKDRETLPRLRAFREWWLAKRWKP